MAARSTIALATPLCLGIFTAAWGSILPVYTDASQAAWLKLHACDGGSVMTGWHQKLESLETLRHPLMQGGISLVLATATIWLLLKRFGSIKTFDLFTPRTKLQYFVLGLVVLGLSWGSQVHSLSLDLSRGEFPWCADSVAIPMHGLIVFYSALIFASLLAGATLAAFFGPLPQTLLVWRSDNKVRSSGLTLFFAILALPLLLFGVLGATGSSFTGTPAAIIAIYLLASTRSALICGGSHHQN